VERERRWACSNKWEKTTFSPPSLELWRLRALCGFLSGHIYTATLGTVRCTVTNQSCIFRTLNSNKYQFSRSSIVSFDHTYYYSFLKVPVSLHLSIISSSGSFSSFSIFFFSPAKVWSYIPFYFRHTSTHCLLTSTLASRTAPRHDKTLIQRQRKSEKDRRGEFSAPLRGLSRGHPFPIF